jgi:ABC-type polysaccharide/polyol phosphate transport system ATPase subunit
MSDVAVRAHLLSKKFRQQPERRTNLKERFVRGRGGEVTEFWPMRDVTFELSRGESLGILGRNGAGKSTALKVLAGIYRPTSGELSVSGRVSTLIEMGAGFHPELSGRENIRLNGALLGLSRDHVADAMDRIIEETGLRKFIDSPLKVYSSGMKVRLAYAIAIEIDPEILIIDEVIAVGDAEFRARCFDHMNRIKAQGTTMIVVSHAMSTLKDLCDRTLWLAEGRPRLIGPTEDVIAEYTADVARERSAKS